MADQASALRLLRSHGVEEKLDASTERVVAVLSGKGGVGKSNIALNLSIALAARGQRTTILDADFGMANICILAGLLPKYTLTHLLRNGVGLDKIVVSGPGGVRIIPGAGGTSGMADLTPSQRDRIVRCLGSLERSDFLIVDLGAGVSRNVVELAARADDVLIVLTPEPTSMADAYGAIKALAERRRGEPDPRIHLVVNRAPSIKEARYCADRIKALAMQYLQTPVEWGGFVLEDRVVSRAVLARTPFLVGAPRSRAAQAIRLLAAHLAGADSADGRRSSEVLPRIAAARRWFERIFS